MKGFKLQLTALLLFILGSFSASAQVCTPNAIVHFKSSGYALTPEDQHSLDSLTAQIGKTDAAYFELIGHADTKGRADFNMNLSGWRINSVKTYLQKNTSGNKIEYKEFNYGETKPLVNDTTDELRAINRRVEVYKFPVVDGKVVLQNKNGVSISVDAKKVSECGICGTAITSEILTGKEFAANNQPLVSSADGTKLETAATIRMTGDCTGKKDSCSRAQIKIPATYDGEMAIYAPSGTGNNVTWTRLKDQLDYDPALAQYVLNVDLCKELWLSISKPGIRKDIINVSVPNLKREGLAHPYLAGNNPDQEEMSLESVTTLEVKDYTDTSFTTECTDCRSTVMMSDTGVAENGFTYYFNGSLDPAFQSTEKLNSYYTVSLEDYTPIVNFTPANLVIKLPKKYANLVKLYIPAIDSSLNMRRYEKKENQFKTKKPAHPFAITFRKSLSERFMVKDNQLCMKYKKRKNITLAKVKKKYMIPIK